MLERVSGLEPTMTREAIATMHHREPGGAAYTHNTSPSTSESQKSSCNGLSRCYDYAHHILRLSKWRIALIRASESKYALISTPELPKAMEMSSDVENATSNENLFVSITFHQVYRIQQ